MIGGEMGFVKQGKATGKIHSVINVVKQGSTVIVKEEPIKKKSK
jgi:hypothetical protein